MNIELNKPPKLHPQMPEFLHCYYDAWLNSPMPDDDKQRKVAGDKCRKRILLGKEYRLQNEAVLAMLQNVFVNEEGRIWVWSDLHLFHNNIIEYTHRPFQNADAMNHAMLSAARQLVTADDWLLILGDVSFGDIDATQTWLRACPGKKVLVLGNHDVTNLMRLESFVANGLFHAVVDCLDWHLPQPLRAFTGEGIERIWLTHYPFWQTWIPKNVLNIHGHTHDMLLDGRRLNVSVECLDYRPHDLRELIISGNVKANTQATT